MVQKDAVFSGRIPELYDKYIGPALMVPYAGDLAARLSGMQSGTLLEIAAGTGIVTEALATALPGVTIVASDLNQPMLDHAATKPALSGVRFRQADAQQLPFGGESFDAVVCQFGAMFFPDRRAAYREVRRVLKPDGRFLFNVWASTADNPYAAAIVAGLSRRYPDHGSWFLERTPHGYHDPDIIKSDLVTGGFARCRVETIALRGRVASASALAVGLCQGSPMRSEIEALDPTGLTAATKAAASAIAERFGEGEFETDLCALVIEAA